jgi:hypothetical protein
VRAHAQFLSVEMVSHERFSPGWPRIVILLILASSVAELTGMLHYAQILVEMGVL